MTGWDNCKYPRIFELLKEQQKTAADMARGIGVSKGNITTWKSGSSAPSNTALLAIANYLDTTTDYLTGKTDIKEKPSDSGACVTSEESALLAAYRSKPQNVKNAVKALLEIEV